LKPVKLTLTLIENHFIHKENRRNSTEGIQQKEFNRRNLTEEIQQKEFNRRNLTEGI